MMPHLPQVGHQTSPLYVRMHEHLLKLEILHADETALQVLYEPGRYATSKSYLWLYRTGREKNPYLMLTDEVRVILESIIHFLV